MKKNLGYILIGGFLYVNLLFCLCSCTRRDFDETEPVGNVTISFDWQNLKTGDGLPEGMKLYFYSSDGSVITREATASGFSGTLSPGTYQVLTYNTDGNNVQQRNLNSYNNAEVYVPVYTRSSSFLSQPSHSYGVGLGTFTVTEGASSSATMVPHNFVRQALFKIEAGEYADLITQCSASLTGFSTGAYISSGVLLDNSGDLYFETEKVNTAFTSSISFLGKNDYKQNVLHLELQLASGSTQSLDVDITTELADVNTTQVDIEVDVSIQVLEGELILSGVTIKPWTEVNAGGEDVN